jgi:ATP-dependent DNA helicase RecQ
MSAAFQPTSFSPDVALRFMARDYPKNEHEMRRVPGVGERKYEEFGEIFLNAIGDYLKANPHLVTTPKPPSSTTTPGRSTRTVNDTAGETLRLLEQGKTVDEIAQVRDLTPGTIYQHIVAAIESGRLHEIDRFFDAVTREEIKGVFGKFGPANLTGVFEALDGKYSYGQLRVFRAFEQHKSTT